MQEKNLEFVEIPKPAVTPKSVKNSDAGGEEANENEDYTPNIAKNFGVWIVKFPCVLALHFVLYPEVANGMSIMKFANNQSHLFVNSGAEISYVLGLIQVLSSLLCEFINIYMLAYQKTI